MKHQAALRPAATLLLAALVAACQTTGGGSSSELRGDYSHVKIDRIGDLGVTDTEFQNVSIRNALALVESKQIPAESVEKVVIQSEQAIGPPFARRSFGRPVSFRMWLYLEGCDRDLMITASPAGRLTSVTDTGKCLSRGPRNAGNPNAPAGTENPSAGTF